MLMIIAAATAKIDQYSLRFEKYRYTRIGSQRGQNHNDEENLMATQSTAMIARTRTRETFVSVSR
jgi:hypothetical protein